MNRTNERGNVLFYILIAIVLLAALSYAIARSSQGNVSQLSDEQSRLEATQILEYADSVSSSVSQMKMRGVKETSICFDDAQATEDYNYGACSDEYNKLFGVSGGGITWSKISEKASTGSGADLEWRVYGNNEVNGLGTTCAGDTCTDLLLMATHLKQSVCMKINELLDVTQSDIDPPTNAGYGTTPYTGVYSYNTTISAPALNGKSAACFKDTISNSYAFYKVLVAR